MNLIYHTSHCGSTLLTALLSTVNQETYAEPSYLHEMIIQRQYSLNFGDIEHLPVLVKLPSGLCHTAVQTDVRKVFLYRPLGEHLVKVYNSNLLNETYLGYYYEYMMGAKHPRLKDMELDSPLKKHIFMWVNRVLWLQESKNVLWVKAVDFFTEMKSTTTKICSFLGIPSVTNFSISTVDVKVAGLNHTDIPVNRVQINYDDKKAVGYHHGVIPEMLWQEDEEIAESCTWLLKHLPELENLVS